MPSLNSTKTEETRLNATASKSARERNTLNNQTREFVEEAQKNKDLRDKFNQEVLDLKAQRNELNDKANVLFEDIEVFKKEHGSTQEPGHQGTPEADRVHGLPAADRGLYHR